MCLTYFWLCYIFFLSPCSFHHWLSLRNEGSDIYLGILIVGFFEQGLRHNLWQILVIFLHLFPMILGRGEGISIANLPYERENKQRNTPEGTERKGRLLTIWDLSSTLTTLSAAIFAFSSISEAKLIRSSVSSTRTRACSARFSASRTVPWMFLSLLSWLASVLLMSLRRSMRPWSTSETHDMRGSKINYSRKRSWSSSLPLQATRW